MTVRRGLDPRIRRKDFTSRMMDCRVKPGNDNGCQNRALPERKNAARNWAAFGFEVQRVLLKTLPLNR
jgi:hypothetical protein